MDPLRSVVDAAYAAVRDADAAAFLATLHPDGRDAYLEWLRTDEAAYVDVQARATRLRLPLALPVDGTDLERVQCVLAVFAPEERTRVPRGVTIVARTGAFARLQFELDDVVPTSISAEGEALAASLAAQGLPEAAGSLADMGIPPYEVKARYHEGEWKLVALPPCLIPLTGYGDVLSYWALDED